MGDLEQKSELRLSGGPGRCPYCHDEVERTKERWVACEACLARHHAACWSENGCCAGCGESDYVGPGLATDAGAVAAAPPAPRIGEPVPALDVELRGRRAHFEADGRPLVLLARPDRAVEPFEVRVANGTRLPQRVELRRLPDHVRAVGPTELTIEAGTTARFQLEYRGEEAPRSSQRRSGRGGALWLAKLSGGSFLLSCEEDAHTVDVEARHPHGPGGLGLMSLLLGTIGAHVGLIFAIILAVQASGADPGGQSAEAILQRREREQAKRMATALGAVLAVTAAIALAIGLAVAGAG